MLKIFAVAAGSALLMLAPGVAAAQGDDDDGMLCVYDALSAGDKYDMVADAYLQNTASEDFDEAQAEVVSVSKTCADKFDMSEDDLSAAIDLGVYGVTIDYLTDNLMFMGASDAAIEGVFDVYGRLSALDVEMFFDPEWRNNAAFKAQLKADLVKAGLPDDTETLDVAYEILQLSAETDDIMYSFMLDDTDDEPESAKP